MKSRGTMFSLLIWPCVSLLFLGLGLLLEGTQLPWLRLQYPFFTPGRAFNSYRQKSQNYSTDSQCKYTPWFVKLNHICPFLTKRTQSGKDRSRAAAQKQIGQQQGTSAAYLQPKNTLSYAISGFSIFFAWTVSYSLASFPSRKGFDQDLLPFQLVLATGEPTLSTSAMLSSPSVPAMEHHPSPPPSTRRGGYSMQQLQEHGQPFYSEYSSVVCT